MDSVKTYNRLQCTDFYVPASFLFCSIGRLLDITYSAITYPRLVRTSFLARRAANALLTTDLTDRPAYAAQRGQSLVLLECSD